MKRLLIIAFCVSVLALFGCALVDYGPVYDNDQVKQEDDGLVNTSGKAFIQQDSRVGWVWPDHFEEILYFVDQNPAANKSNIYNYINWEPNPGYAFYGQTYCNPDFNGCSYFTAQREINNIVEFYPYSYNPACGDYIVYFILSAARYSECGRTLPLADKISMLNMGELGTLNDEEGLYYDLNRTNFSITLENDYGQTFDVPIMTDFSLFYNVNEGQITIDASNPIMGNMLNWYADWSDSHSTDMTTVHFTYNGISDSRYVGGNVDSDKFRNGANKLY